MHPIKFAQQTVIVAEHQEKDGYLPLPALQDEKHTISCWQLSWKERLRVLLFGQVWAVQMNFSRAVQPLALCVDPPFEPVITDEGSIW